MICHSFPADITWARRGRMIKRLVAAANQRRPAKNPVRSTSTRLRGGAAARGSLHPRAPVPEGVPPGSSVTCKAQPSCHFVVRDEFQPGALNCKEHGEGCLCAGMEPGRQGDGRGNKEQWADSRTWILPFPTLTAQSPAFWVRKDTDS